MDVIQPGLASVARNERNLGFPGNANSGVARASGDIIFLVNQDIYALWGWSNAWDSCIIATFEDPKVGVAGIRLIQPTGAIQSAGGGFDARRQPYHRFLGHRGLHDIQVTTPCEVGWTTGAALATRRQLWRQVGGFEEAYGRGYFEDVEYCLRVRDLGWKIWFQGSCAFFHSVASTGGSMKFEFEQNARLFRKRWAHKIQPDTEEVKVPFW